MKASGILVFLTFICLYSNVQSQASLTVGDVRTSWITKQGTVEEVLLSVRPKGLFMEYGLYLSFSAKGQNYKVNDSLEVVLQFTLPEKAIVTDSWLWIGEDICQAALLDIWTASNIYENIVNRRKDPSLLRKHSATSYSLRVFPMGGSEKRSVKITYLVPVNWKSSEISIAIPHEIPNASKFIPLDFPVIVWDHPDFNFVKVDNVNSSPIESSADPVLGTYKTFTLAPAGTFKPTNLVFNQLKPEPAFLGVYKSGEEHFYQLAIQPGSYINEVKSNKILYLIDYQEIANLPKETVLNSLKNEIKLSLRSSDSFNLLVTNINAYPIFNVWHSASPGNIDLAFDLAKTRMANFSNLPSIIEKGILFLDANGKKGNIVLLNNSDQFNGFNAANDLIKYITGLNSNAYKISVLDYGNRTKSSYFNNKYYYDNEYLLVNLATLYGGNYVATRNGKALTTALNEVNSDALPIIKYLEIYFKPNRGISYGKYNMQNIGLNTSLNTIIRQLGIFKGEYPLTIELNGEINNQLFFHTLVIDENEVITLDSSAKKQWQAQGIQSLEAQSNGSTYSFDILRKSLDSRILSLYTAFLCVEDTSLYCKTCIDEKNVPTANEDVNLDSLWDVKIYPNPFVDHLNVEVHFKNQIPLKNNIQGKILDLSGRTLHRFEAALENGDYLKYQWNGITTTNSIVPSGVYIMLLDTGQGTIQKKVMRY
ncbi:MAG: T9SS type A sorting domain-containing protein [Saprospiraceae bacterium]|nr:T9SS type A sorting domain-containing protein [Saprospiraceae bacterium]